MAAQPSRNVEGNVLSSTHMPRITIRVDNAFEYIGNLQFILSDAVQADQFIFIEHQRQRVSRMFIVQFEGYLDGVDKSFNYPIDKTLPLGEYKYMHDSQFQNLKAMVEERPDSDYGRTGMYLREQGYCSPEYVIRERFVRLLDEAKRNELLLIYAEDLSYGDLTAWELYRVDEASEWWKQVIEGLVERALGGFEVVEE